MKKGFVLFFIYSAIIITSLCLFLVFYKNTELEQPTKPETEQTSPTPENPMKPETPDDDNEDSTLYATDLTLNCPRTIYMEQNSSIELLEGYISVLPAEKLNSVTYSISIDTGIENGLTFSNNNDDVDV